MLYIPNFMKICSGILNFIGWRHKDNVIIS
jgi:hypothetical protein